MLPILKEKFDLLGNTDCNCSYREDICNCHKREFKKLKKICLPVKYNDNIIFKFSNIETQENI